MTTIFDKFIFGIKRMLDLILRWFALILRELEIMHELAIYSLNILQLESSGFVIDCLIDLQQNKTYHTTMLLILCRFDKSKTREIYTSQVSEAKNG